MARTPPNAVLCESDHTDALQKRNPENLHKTVGFRETLQSYKILEKSGKLDGFENQRREYKGYIVSCSCNGVESEKSGTPRKYVLFQGLQNFGKSYKDGCSCNAEFEENITLVTLDYIFCNPENARKNVGFQDILQNYKNSL